MNNIESWSQVCIHCTASQLNTIIYVPLFSVTPCWIYCFPCLMICSVCHLWTLLWCGRNHRKLVLEQKYHKENLSLHQLEIVSMLHNKELKHLSVIQNLACVSCSWVSGSWGSAGAFLLHTTIFKATQHHASYWLNVSPPYVCHHSPGAEV